MVPEQLSRTIGRSQSAASRDIASHSSKAHLYLMLSFAAERHSVKTYAVLCALAGIIAFATPVLGAQTQSVDSAVRNQGLSVMVEIEGSVPGFTKDELSAYLCRQMEATHLTGWHFLSTPLDATGGDQPSNRIVWHFKPLPYGGGGTRYIGPAVSKA